MNQSLLLTLFVAVLAAVYSSIEAASCLPNQCGLCYRCASSGICEKESVYTAPAYYDYYGVCPSGGLVCSNRVYGWNRTNADAYDCQYFISTATGVRCVNGSCWSQGYDTFLCFLYHANHSAPATLLNSKSCVAGCDIPTACTPGDLFTSAPPASSLCYADKVAADSLGGCGVSSTPCQNWVNGTVSNKCMKFTGTSKGVCRISADVSSCDNSVAACALAGATTAVHLECPSSACYNATACPAGALVSEVTDVCLRDVEQPACGADFDCSTTLKGFNGDVCEVYTGTGKAKCGADGACISGVDTCSATANYATCASSACKKTCTPGASTSTVAVADVCYTDMTHSCGAGMVCGTNGACVAGPPTDAPGAEMSPIVANGDAPVSSGSGSPVSADAPASDTPSDTPSAAPSVTQVPTAADSPSDANALVASLFVVAAFMTMAIFM